jgi:hypothetical protein
LLSEDSPPAETNEEEEEAAAVEWAAEVEAEPLPLASGVDLDEAEPALPFAPAADAEESCR